jgi:uncharacterized protein
MHMHIPMPNDREPWRRLASWVLAALVAFAALAVLPVSSARAQAAAGQVAVPRQQGAVTDLTDTLNADQVATLSQKIATLHDTAGPTLAVLIVPTTGTDSIEQFATRVFDAWKPGTAQDDNGLLLLVALNDRHMRIEVGQGLEGQVPDLVANQIIEEQMKPRFRQKDYFGGIDAAVDALASLLGGAALPAAGEIDAPVGDIAPPEEPAHGWTVTPGGWVLLSILAATLAYVAYRWRAARPFVAGVAVLGGVGWAVAHFLGTHKLLWGLLGVVVSAIVLALLAFVLYNMRRSYRQSRRIFYARWVVVIAITILTAVLSGGEAVQTAMALFFTLLFAFLPGTAGSGSGGSDSDSGSSSSSSDSSSSSSSDSSSSSSSDSGGSSSGGGSSGSW